MEQNASVDAWVKAHGATSGRFLRAASLSGFGGKHGALLALMGKGFFGIWYSLLWYPLVARGHGPGSSETCLSLSSSSSQLHSLRGRQFDREAGPGPLLVPLDELEMVAFPP